MNTGFIGSNLRLARLFHDLSLTELGDKVGVSKQFLSRIETGAEPASGQLQVSLAEELRVLPEFFHRVDTHPIADEQCHFRRQLTTKVALRQVARARGEMLKRLIGVLDEHVELPSYQVKEADAETFGTWRPGRGRRRYLRGGAWPLASVRRLACTARERGGGRSVVGAAVWCACQDGRRCRRSCLDRGRRGG